MQGAFEMAAQCELQDLPDDALTQIVTALESRERCVLLQLPLAPLGTWAPALDSRVWVLCVASSQQCYSAEAGARPNVRGCHQYIERLKC